MLHPNIFILKAICLLFLSITLVLSPVFSQTTDATFGMGGKVMTAINDTSTANTIALQVDGKIVVAGSTIVGGKEYAALVRYNIDGSLDNTFGSAGKVVSLLPDVKRINTIALQQDGKIVAGGISNNDSTFNGDFTLIRYNSNGSKDNLFGTNGVAKVDMQGSGIITKILVKSDGKILAGGTLGLPTFESIPALAQLNANGSADSLFGLNGKVARYEGNILGINDMDFAKDGKIIATGQPKSFGNSNFALLRFFANGNVDSSFGNNGVIITDFNSSDDVSTALAIQADSTIILAGRSYKSSTLTQFALAKYHSNGTLDSSFGNGGKVLTLINNTTALATDVVVSTDGSLIASGYNFRGNNDFVVTKYFPNGKTDSTFGTNGIITTDFAGFEDRSFSSAIQPDGKIILAGKAGSSSSTYSIALARFTTKVLPLNLLTFSATKAGAINLLQWTTANEINVHWFEIERSANGKDYNSIGNVNAGLVNYSFIDDKPFNGTNYYRLKMIDKDGHFEYSSVKNIVSSNNFYVNVYPLPANDKLNIQIVSAETGKAGMSVTDVSGKELIRNSVTISAGITNTFMNVQKLGAGIYFLKIVTTVATETRKITIAK